MENENRNRWSAGKTPNAPKRIVQLAKLYRRYEALELLPNVERSEWLRLASDFAALKANVHANKCMERSVKDETNIIMVAVDRT